MNNNYVKWPVEIVTWNFWKWFESVDVYAMWFLKKERKRKNMHHVAAKFMLCLLTDEQKQNCVTVDQ